MKKRFKIVLNLAFTAGCGYAAWKTLDVENKINEARDEGGFQDFLRYQGRRKANGIPELTVEEVPKYYQERYKKHLETRK
jgi:hypothetical protein